MATFQEKRIVIAFLVIDLLSQPSTNIESIVAFADTGKEEIPNEKNSSNNS
jgi:hypothetical protein